MTELIKAIAEELSLNEANVRNAVKLLFEEECTIPFVARYRKEMTGSMDEVSLRNLRDRHQYLAELEATKEKYIKNIEELALERPEINDRLPELKRKFLACKTKQEVEDLYLPFKPKRRTRAQAAKEKGLEPLLDKILLQRATLLDLQEVASAFVTTEDQQVDPKLRVPDVAAALAGAADIMAERISETASLRALVRAISFETGRLISQKADSKDFENNPKKKAQIAKYQNYFDYSEPIQQAASHRIMAVRRGETEKILRLYIDVDSPRIIQDLSARIIDAEPTSTAVRNWLSAIIEDAYRRLIAPSIETEIRVDLKKRAEEEAVKVFSTNLENLLLLPPIPNQVVMGVDPGIRTGSKLAVISQNNKLLAHTTVYPDFQQLDSEKSRNAGQTIAKFIKDYQVVYIAIGNGTGSREIDQLISKVLRDNEEFKHVKRVIVNESGASVYSTDEIAREEFPDLDPTIRSAVSIARRLQDPLAELVKIDPKSIGVGQYQHDCNPARLSRTLQDTVESCVNRVGVNVNTASYKLLAYVSGISSNLAKNIVIYRNESGNFRSRKDFLNISGFGPKTFEQAAGFLRIPGAENPLDNSAVHPESYETVEHIAKDLGVSVDDLIGKESVIGTIPLEKYVSDQIGMPTLMDITTELKKPGRDPREDGIRLHYSDSVTSLEDLKIGMKLKGTVSNVTNFGAFVDIGVHQDGLVHISELSDEFVKDPARVVSVGDVIEVRVLDVDIERRRISLTCKAQTEAKPRANGIQKDNTKPTARARPHQGHQRHDRPSSQSQPREAREERRTPPPHKRHDSGNRGKQKPSYSVGDLLSKFNTRN